MQRLFASSAIGVGTLVLACSAFADGFYPSNPCSALPSQANLQGALEYAVAQSNGGLGNNMWATLVANDGTVCAVAFSGAQYTDQWLGSRVISAQKANTANDFNLSNGARLKGAGLALSTANLYSAVQPGGSLYGLQHSNPVDSEVAYQGNAALYGTAQDPLVGQRVGGVNVFGGGLGLYAASGKKIGGVGVSGDTSCTDHFVAWWVRYKLKVDHLMSIPGVTGDTSHPDNIIYDINPASNGGILDPGPGGTLSSSAGGFGHPQCNPPTPGGVTGPSALPAVQN